MTELQTSPVTSGLKWKYVMFIVIILGLVALGIISLLRERIVNPNEYQVSFTAEGRAFVKPDIAQLAVAVKTDRVMDAVKAVQQNTDKMNQVLSKIKELGIDEKDIKTTAYRLNPIYDYRQETGQSTLGGYEVYQEVLVKIRDLGKVAEIIKTATDAGANQVGSISFTIDDTEEVKKPARAEAVAKAKERANEMVRLTGIKLGQLVNVYENLYPGPVTPEYSYAKMDIGGYGGGGAALEIQVGENEVRVEVTLVYEVK